MADGIGPDEQNTSPVSQPTTHTPSEAQPPKPQRDIGKFLVGLTATAPIAPGILMVTIIVAYMGGKRWPTGAILLVGFVGGIIGWGILAVVAQYFATIDRANPGVYRELRSRVESLETQVNELGLVYKEVDDSVRTDPLGAVKAGVARLRNKLQVEEGER